MKLRYILVDLLLRLDIDIELGLFLVIPNNARLVFGRKDLSVIDMTFTDVNHWSQHLSVLSPCRKLTLVISRYSCCCRHIPTMSLLVNLSPRCAIPIQYKNENVILCRSVACLTSILVQSQYSCVFVCCCCDDVRDFSASLLFVVLPH